VRQIDLTKKNCIYWIGTEDGFMGMLGFFFCWGFRVWELCARREQRKSGYGRGKLT
jgi:hypothetical protein